MFDILISLLLEAPYVGIPLFVFLISSGSLSGHVIWLVRNSFARLLSALLCVCKTNDDELVVWVEMLVTTTPLIILISERHNLLVLQSSFLQKISSIILSRLQILQ